MTIEALAATVLSVLLPYVTKGGEQFAKEAGKAAFAKVKELFNTLQSGWSDDKEASDALTNFEKKPARYQAPLQEILNEKLAADEKLQSLLSRFVTEMGPHLEIVQKMKVGKGITGLDADEMTSGTARIDQEMEQGENVVGVKIKRIGSSRSSSPDGE